MTTARQMLQAQKDAGATHRAIAEKLGYSHTAITLYVNGKYPGGIARLEARIVEVYSRIACPFLTRDISLADCTQYRTQDCPTSSPMAVRHWQACKSCAHNPDRPTDTAWPALRDYPNKEAA